MTKLQTTITLIVFVALTVFGFNQYQNTQKNVGKSNAERIKGNSKAVLNIVEYIDFQCPSCAYGSKLLSETMTAYPDLIQLELKYFPLGMHKHAFVASRYAECALRQGKFWEFHDKVLSQQKSWKNMINVFPAFDLFIDDEGINNSEFRQCLDDPKVEAVINKHKAQGKSLGVRSTPTYFVNGEMIVGSKFLKDKIDAQLAQ
jgi:protein-disulfide isomerase